MEPLINLYHFPTFIEERKCLFGVQSSLDPQSEEKTIMVSITNSNNDEALTFKLKNLNSSPRPHTAKVTSSRHQNLASIKQVPIVFKSNDKPF